MAKLTVRLRDTVSDTAIEVDGEELPTAALQVTTGGGSGLVQLDMLIHEDLCEVVDERSGAEEK